jgi:hypothetical protein
LLLSEAPQAVEHAARTGTLSLFWPTIRNDGDLDYLTEQGFWICFVVSVVSEAYSWFAGHRTPDSLTLCFSSLRVWESGCAVSRSDFGFLGIPTQWSSSSDIDWSHDLPAAPRFHKGADGLM